MDFTREPIIETVITPREGCKLVVRSSKGAGQEEYFVDALEVVSFGSSFFFRSMERPKSFIVPATDYEVLEVRETRMVLKNVGIDRTIKIAGGREAPKAKEHAPKDESESRSEQPRNEPRGGERKRERRRSYRRRGRGGKEGMEEGQQDGEGDQDERIDLPPPETSEGQPAFEPRTVGSFMSSLLPPPSTLISETIQRYKQDDLYKEAFFTDEEKKETRHVAIEESSQAEIGSSFIAEPAPTPTEPEEQK